MLTTPSRLVRIASAISETADRRARDYRLEARRALMPEAGHSRRDLDSRPVVYRPAVEDSRRGDMRLVADSRGLVDTVAVEDSRRHWGIVPAS